MCIRDSLTNVLVNAGKKKKAAKAETDTGADIAEDAALEPADGSGASAEEKTEAGDSAAGEEKNDPPEQEGKENTNGEV